MPSVDELVDAIAPPRSRADELIEQYRPDADRLVRQTLRQQQAEAAQPGLGTRALAAAGDAGDWIKQTGADTIKNVWGVLNTPIIEVYPGGGMVLGREFNDEASIHEIERIAVEGTSDERIGLGLRAGGESFLSGMVTPLSLGTLGAAGLLVQAPKISRLMSAAFALDTGKGLAFDTAQALGEEYAKAPADRDLAKITELWTSSGLSGPLAGALGAHAIQGNRAPLLGRKPTRPPSAQPDAAKAAPAPRSEEVSATGEPTAGTEWITPTPLPEPKPPSPAELEKAQARAAREAEKQRAPRAPVPEPEPPPAEPPPIIRAPAPAPEKKQPTADELIAQTLAEAQKQHEKHLAGLKEPVGDLTTPIGPEVPARLFQKPEVADALARLKAKAAKAAADAVAPAPEPARVAVSISAADAKQIRESRKAVQRASAMPAAALEPAGPDRWQPPRAEAVDPVAAEPKEREYLLTDAVRDAGGLSAPKLDEALAAMRKGKTAAEVVKAWSGTAGEYDALPEVLEEVAAARDEGRQADYRRLRKAYGRAFRGDQPGGVDMTLDGIKLQAQAGFTPPGGAPENASELIARLWGEARRPPLKIDHDATRMEQAAADQSAFENSLSLKGNIVHSGDQPLAEVRTDKRGGRFLVPGPEAEGLPPEYQRAVMGAAGLEAEHGMVAYRGEYFGNKGGKFYHEDPEFARQFTQSGRDEEIKVADIPDEFIYRAKKLPYGGDPDQVHAAVAAAKAKGFKAIFTDEGSGGKPSVYVFDKAAIRNRGNYTGEAEHGMDAGGDLFSSAASGDRSRSRDLDPTILKDLTKLAADVIEEGKAGFPDFAREMGRQLDGGFAEYYHAAYNQVREFTEGAHLKARLTPREEIENYDSTGQRTQQPGAPGGGPEFSGTVGGAGSIRRPGLRVVDEGDIPAARPLVRSGEYTGPTGAGIDETQRYALNLALTAFDQGKTAFLLGDGTGVGKTGTELALAHQSNLRTKLPSLIVTQSSAIIDNRFKADQIKFGIPAQGTQFITYTDLSLGKVPKGEFGVVIFDEAHNLKRQGSNRQFQSELLKARNKVYATATPMDSPTHAAYFLGQLTGRTRAQIAASLGYHFEEQMTPQGMREFAVLDKEISWARVVDRIRDYRMQAVRGGQFIRREYPFFGRAAMREAPAFGPEQVREQREIEQYWNARIAAARTPQMRRNLSGQKTGELSRWAEIQKLPWITEALIEDLAAGKHVVVFAEGYNPTHIKGLGKTVPGLLSELGRELDRRGIKYAKVFEDTGKEKAAAGQMFQRGEAKVLLATPKSGGAGLDMDDQIGNQPRQGHAATLNFAGDVFDQMLGRFSRRNTASPAEFHVWSNRESYSDRRRVAVADHKLRVLRNIQAGRDLDVSEFERTAAEQEHGMDVAGEFSFELPEGVAQQQARQRSEAERKALLDVRSEVLQRVGKRLAGGTGDLGQGDFMGGGDLFAPKPAKAGTHGKGQVEHGMAEGTRKRAFPSYTTADLKRMVSEPGLAEEMKQRITSEIAARESGASTPRITPQITPGWKASPVIMPERGEIEHGFAGNATLVQAAAQDLSRIRNLVAPQTGGGPQRFAGNLLRELNSRMANELARADVALRKFRRDFDRTPVNPRKFKYDPTAPLPRNFAFIDAYESGNTAALSKSDQAGAAELHKLNQADLARVHALGTGALTTFYANYFPHIWKNPKLAASVFGKILGRAPLEGPKSFLKQRTHKLFEQGLAAGLKPAHDNPIDLWLLKKREVERYIMAHDFTRQMKEAGLMKFNYAFAKVPDGWATVNDRAFTVYGPPTVTMKEAFDAGMREATLDLLKDLGVPHERLARIGGRDRWGYERDTPGVPGSERIVTKFAGPDFVIWHELGHVLKNRYPDLATVLTATDVMKSELAALAAARTDATSPAAFKRNVQTLDEQVAAVLQGFVHAPERMGQLAPTVKMAFENFLQAHPELAKINDIRPGMRLGVGAAEMSHGGLLKLGDYVMPEAAAKVVNNFLSPGLNPHLWYRTLRQTGNLLNSVQLGLSAFHLGFTSLDAATSRLAVAIEDAVGGKIGTALATAASVPVSPLTNIRTGAKLRAEVLRPGTHPEMAELAKAMEQAGGRTGLDAFWQTHFTRRMMRAWHQGGLQWASLPIRLPLAAWEQTMRPILEYIVPRQKLGVFADMASRELAKLGPAADPGATREALRKVWDSVDNRMGQVVYDNLFYNRMVKDVALIAFRAYGWQLGKYREGVGAGLDAARAAGKLVRGERPEFTHRMAYIVALPLMVGTIGGVLHYLLTGRKPDQAADYFMPQTGEVDKNGNPVRLNLPSYVKDAIAYSRHPVTSVGHSLHPMWSATFDLLQNKDFYDVRIRDREDPLWKQGSDVAEFAAKQFVPFALSGAVKLREEGSPLWKQFAPYFGFTPVPLRITMDPAQELAAEIMASRFPEEPRTREAFDRSKLIKEIVQQMRAPGTQAAGAQKLGAAMEARKLDPASINTIITKVRYTPFQFQLHMMPVEDALRVWRIATPARRQEIEPILRVRVAQSPSVKPEDRLKFMAELDRK